MRLALNSLLYFFCLVNIFHNLVVIYVSLIFYVVHNLRMSKKLQISKHMILHYWPRKGWSAVCNSLCQYCTYFSETSLLYWLHKVTISILKDV